MSAQPKRFHLHKQHSWSPDAHRDEAWLRRRHSSRRHTKSVTDDDLDELKACIELGFGFSPEKDPRLTDTIPALDLYYAVNKQYNDTVSKSSNTSDCDPSDVGSPKTPNIIIPCPGNNDKNFVLFCLYVRGPVCNFMVFRSFLRFWVLWRGWSGCCEDEAEAMGSGGCVFGAAVVLRWRLESDAEGGL